MSVMQVLITVAVMQSAPTPKDFITVPASQGTAEMDTAVKVKFISSLVLLMLLYEKLQLI